LKGRPIERYRKKERKKEKKKKRERESLALQKSDIFSLQ